MKKIISSGVAAAALLVAAPAFAADIAQPYPVKAAPMIVAEPVFSWTGFYIGGNFGYGWGTGEGHTGNLGVDPSGWLGGGQIGFNYQFDNNVVLGAEADFQGAGISDERYGIESSLDYFGTIRARLGYAVDNFMPYVTGGFAYGRHELRDQVIGATVSTNATGWTVGGGLEYAIDNNWIARAEYLHVDLGDDYFSRVGYTSGINTNIVRAGINYKF